MNVYIIIFLFRIVRVYLMSAKPKRILPNSEYVNFDYSNYIFIKLKL